MTTFFSRLLEMDLHELEEAEQDALLDLMRAGHSLLRQRPSKAQLSETQLKKEPQLMARQTVTDDQVITLTFALTDGDKVAVEGNSAPVVVTTVDDAGADVSKWISAVQDSADPLKFVLSRKPNDDGTQPQEISFSSIGTLQVGGEAKTHQDDYLYTPGAPENLSSTVVIGAAPVAAGDSALLQQQSA